MSSETPILSRRIGARMFHSGLWILSDPGTYKCSWPLGALAIYDDRIEIGACFRRFVIPWPAVDDIRRRPWLGEVQIGHHQHDVPDQIFVRGLIFGGLYDRMAEAVRRLRVPVSVS